MTRCAPRRHLTRRQTTMGFSGALKIADLNDFIAPSQACVITLDSVKDEIAKADFLQTDVVEVRDKPSKNGWSQTLPLKNESDAVKISLQDCLACSGCVTSAETVLLEHQSVGEFRDRLRDPGKHVVVSVSQQSAASLAVAHGLSTETAARKLSGLLRSLGVKAVFDIGAAREVSLRESAKEFIVRYKRAHPGAIQLEAAASHEERNGLQNGMHSVPASAASRNKRRRTELPVLASACPGWICYAEKTHGEYALPYISTVKSPQAMMGSLVKGQWAHHHNLAPDSIYHCSVMPCYDKKLEASREDFNLTGTTIPETDSVLTTGEIQQLLDEEGVDLASCPEEDFDSIFPEHRKQKRLIGRPGVSGGYLEYIYRVASKQIFGQEIGDGDLQMKTIRNTDFREITMQTPTGTTALRFASAYGFRNIQTLLRKIKQGVCQYDYVEIMACPAGCTNGGGQIKPGAGESAQTVIARVEAAYHQSVKSFAVESSDDVEEGASPGNGADFIRESASSWMHTQYHKRDKSLAATLKDW